MSLLHLKRTGPSKRRKNHDEGIRAGKPLSILHADVTIFRTLDNQKNYIYFVQDNFSRAILAQTVALECKATITLDNLSKVREVYLKPKGVDCCQLITDDGSENAGPVSEWVNGSTCPSIERLIAQRDIVFSNSMIEAANKQIKYRFLYHKSIPDFESLKRYVSEAIEDYNNRPHDVLGGLTPLEVLNGKIIDTVGIQQQIMLAKVARVAENKKLKSGILKKWIPYNGPLKKGR